MRIFVAPDELRAGELSIRSDEHHYMSRVRRARAGDAVELVDGAGRHAAAQIVRITDSETIVQAAAPEPVPAAIPRIRVLIPWIKGDRMDVCVEKAVEVGADELVIWPAMRAVVQLTGARRDARVAKLRAAAVAAARQCGSAVVPEVGAVDSLAAAIAGLPAASVRYALDPAAARSAPATTAADVTLASGPEGGFDPRELDALLAAGFVSFGLGPRTLRAETAPVVAVALVRAANEQGGVR